MPALVPTRPPVLSRSLARARALVAAAARAAAASASLALATPAGAQQPAPVREVSPGCAPETLLQDACQSVADLFTFLTPQVGAALAGGSATLGQAGITGGFGHVSFAFRVSGLRGERPDLAASPPQPGAANQRSIPVREQLVVLPQLDLSIGLLRGLPLGATNVGGLDLLLSGSWIPDVATDEVEVRTPGSGFRVGYGARLTLVQETFTTPSLSVSYMRRDTPATSITARTGGGADTVSVSRFRLHTDSWRVMGGKSFYNFGLAAGIGQDRIGSAGDLAVVLREDGVETRTASPIPYERDLTRTNAFVDLTVAVRSSRLVFELGRAWGGDADTYNDFAGTSADAARLYGSIGLRMGF